MPSTSLGAVLAIVSLIAVAPTELPAQNDPAVAGHPPAETAAPEPSPAVAAPFAATGPLGRFELIAAVLERNPGVEEARLAWRAASERVPQATSLDDPMLAYSLAPLSIASSDVPFGHSLEVRQRLPYPGKLRRMGEVARAEADAFARGIETVRLELATAASMLYDDYYLVHRAREINLEHQRLLEGLKRVATARYAAGEAPQAAPIQAEVEIAHLVHEEMVLATAREVLTARINALLHREPGAPLPPPVERLPVPAMAAVDEESLAGAAIAARPELERLEAERAARAAAVELRELDRYPDFEAMASYNSMWRETEHQWMVGVGVNLPVWRERIEAGVAEARAELARVESERARLADEVGAEARIAWARLREAHHVLQIYQSRLLPAAADQVRAATTGFETAQVSFLTLIEAERNQRAVALAYEETLADLYRRGAELDRALGMPPGDWIAFEGDGP